MGEENEQEAKKTFDWLYTDKLSAEYVNIASETKIEEEVIEEILTKKFHYEKDNKEYLRGCRAIKQDLIIGYGEFMKIIDNSSKIQNFLDSIKNAFGTKWENGFQARIKNKYPLIRELFKYQDRNGKVHYPEGAGDFEIVVNPFWISIEGNLEEKLESKLVGGRMNTTKLEDLICFPNVKEAAVKLEVYIHSRNTNYSTEEYLKKISGFNEEDFIFNIYEDLEFRKGTIDEKDSETLLDYLKETLEENMNKKYIGKNKLNPWEIENMASFLAKGFVSNMHLGDKAMNLFFVRNGWPGLRKICRLMKKEYIEYEKYEKVYEDLH